MPESIIIIGEVDNDGRRRRRRRPIVRFLRILQRKRKQLDKTMHNESSLNGFEKKEKKMKRNNERANKAKFITAVFQIFS